MLHRENFVSGDDDIVPQHDRSTMVHAEPFWPLAIFFLLSAALSWTVWLWPLQTQGWLKLVILGWDFKIPHVLIKLVIGNCLPGMLAVGWTLCEGRSQFQQMLSTLTRWRTPLRWYALALALPLGVSVIALGAVLFHFPTQHSFPPLERFLRVLLINLPLGPLWEELAWRAFALRKLESRYSPLISALVLGLFWAIWHIPLWLTQLRLVPTNKSPILLTGVVNLIAWSVIWTYLYHRSSESLPVVILLHTTYGAATTQVALVVPQLNIYVIYVSAALSICLAAFLARSLRISPRTT
jgi:membrane protease YdiL (CAAX protease family)